MQGDCDQSCAGCSILDGLVLAQMGAGWQQPMVHHEELFLPVFPGCVGSTGAVTGHLADTLCLADADQRLGQEHGPVPG